MSQKPSALQRAKQMAYRHDIPYRRAQLFERLGSRRFSHPAPLDIDHRLAELVPPGPGVFVEAGGHDGFTYSNTYYLERFEGWSGVLVEAVPHLAEKATRRRPRSTVVQAALVRPEQEGQDVTLHFGDLTSTMGDAEHATIGLENAGMEAYDFTARGRTLSAVLDEAGVQRPTLMVLDLEGAELDALAGLDLGRHGPEILMIEMLDPETQRAVFDSALGEGYRFVEWVGGSDAIYRREPVTGAG